MNGTKHTDDLPPQVINEQINPNVTKRINWNNLANTLTKTTKTYATSYFTKTKYIKRYNEKKVKDKNGKETKVKEPVYDYKYNHPYVVTAHQFGLNLPATFEAKKITFSVWMKVDKGVTATPPTGRFCIYGKAWNKKTDTKTEKNSKTESEWNEGLWYVHQKKKLTTIWQRYDYVMDADEIARGGFDKADFNSDKMGIDLLFSDGEIKGEIKEANKSIKKGVYFAHVRIKVEYYTPKFKIDYVLEKVNGSAVKGVNSKAIYVGDELTILAKFSSAIYRGTRNLDLVLPAGMELIGTPSTNTGGTYSDYVWSANCKQTHLHTLRFKVKSHRSGDNIITIGDKLMPKLIPFTPFKVNVKRNGFDGYDSISLSIPNEVHKNHRTCLGVDLSGYVESDTTLTYTLSSDKSYTGGEWIVKTQSNVSVNSATHDNVLVLDVSEGEFTATLNYCFYPSVTGKYTITIDSPLSNDGSLSFDVNEPYDYHIVSSTELDTSSVFYYHLPTDIVTVNDHRILTSIDIDTTSIASTSDARDSHMVQSKSTLVMNQQDVFDYIGCVPLEHLHYNPKSTYKDTLLNNTYKNKRYMGKKLASDEDITLNVRLHPHQVTTIQGLIDMDKPIPIDANHKCFEGDALNHRGWAEIYSIKANETNPHWYECDIDVKYLTHNLNTRFKIDKGIKVDRGIDINEYRTSMLMAETVPSGSKLDDLDDDVYIVETEDGEQKESSFFIVDTDGTYAYSTDDELIRAYLDDDGEEIINIGDSTVAVIDENELEGINQIVAYLQDNGYDVLEPVLNESVQVREIIEVPNNQRNLFSIDEGQHIHVSSANPLKDKSIITFEWLSTVMPEDKENLVSRIIRLKDAITKDTIFEYEYTDFTITEDDISCQTIARVRTNDGWGEPYYGTDVDMRLYTTLGSIDDEYPDDIDVDTENDILYGSTLQLTLDNKKLWLIDEGFNGMEYSLGSVEGIDLTSGSYYWETEWINNNQDGETDDIMCYFDITVASTLDNSQYSTKYDKLYVSPFPIRDKNLVFTREAEEGTIYYFEDDLDEFSFLMNPYYQYFNGCDLQNEAGSSIFNLNYGYEVVFILNGLVRLGFNRLNGRLYLGKYDPVRREYIDTHTFHLKKYSDININSIDDDKIEIQASDSVFTIWRGHPYIGIKHNNETIFIDSKFNRIWGEQVGNDISQYPSNYILLNDSNLLPSCVGGDKTIKADCVHIDPVETTSKRDTTLNWGTTPESTPDDMYVGVEDTFYITGTAPTLLDNIPFLSDFKGNLGDYSSELVCNPSVINKLDLFVPKSIIQTNEVDDIQGIVKNNCGEGINNKTVYFYEAYEPKLELNGDKIIQSSETADLTTRMVDSQDGSVIREQGRTIYYFKETESEISSLSVDADNTILSYMDGDDAIITATLLDDSDNPISGETITFKNGSTVLGTDITDNNGEATYTYESQGVGDVTFTVVCGNLQETYSIEDCWKYDSTTYSSNNVYELQLSNSHYSLEFEINKSGSTGGVVIGTSDNYFMVGCGSTNNMYLSRWGTNISFENLLTLTSDTWKTVLLEVNGSNVDIKVDGNTYSVTGVTADTSLFYRININGSGLYIRNLKIKPL